MSTPVNVTVTGAAGQIGYALLFRIASGEMLGDDTPVHLQPARDPRRRQGRRGHRDGARRLRLPAARRDRHPRRPEGRVRRLQHRPARRRPSARPGHGALRPAGGERRDLQAPGRGDQRRRGRRRQDPRRRQPGEHERPDRDGARPRRAERAVHRDGAPRPQPGDRPARARSSTSAVSRDHTDDDLGQPLDDAVPGPRQRRGRTASRPGRLSTTRPGSPTSSSPPSPSAAPRSSTRAARPARRRPRTRRSTTSTTGCSARPTATGSRWGFRPTAPTTSPKGIISGLPVHLR